MKTLLYILFGTLLTASVVTVIYALYYAGKEIKKEIDQ